MKENSWIYQVWMYFDYMSELNNPYISLVKGNYHKTQIDIENQTYKLFELLTKIILYKIKDNECIIRNNSGIIDLLYNSCSDIISEIKKLVTKNNTILCSIKSIRNNTEHSPHRIVCVSVLKTNNKLSYIDLSYTKNNFSDISFDVKNIVDVTIDINNLSLLINDLNSIFFHIKEKIKKEYMMEI